MSYTPLPIGVDDFQEIIHKGYYYVDKTWLIKELLDKKGKVNLFTRPRRFGKTLNLSMLKYFFEHPIENTGSQQLLFYHGFLLGLMVQLQGYLVKSNREAGMGRYDCCIYSQNLRKPVILMEFKLADTYQGLEAAAQTAMNQIHEKKYALELQKEGHTHFFLYGIGFYKKQLQVIVEELIANDTRVK